MHPPNMLKKAQDIKYKQFDNEAQETDQKTSPIKTLLLGTLILTFAALVSTMAYLSFSSGYLFRRHLPAKGKILTRQEWRAADPVPTTQTGDFLKHPVSDVTVKHTGTEPCFDIEDCMDFMRNTQGNCSNFYIGGDGNIYEGMGWDLNLGIMDLDLPNMTITIMFIGTYMNDLPNEDQLEAGRQLLTVGVGMGKIDDDFQLRAHPPHSDSPDFNLLKLLMNSTQEDFFL